MVVCAFSGAAVGLAACSSSSKTSDTPDAAIDFTPFDAGTETRTASPPLVHCDQSTDGGYSCDCTVSSPGSIEAGAPSFTGGVDCDETKGGLFTTICCADLSYPNSGSCNCTEDGRINPYHCELVDPNNCKCSYGFDDSDASVSCDPKRFNDAGVCCAYPASVEDYLSITCNCYAGGGACEAPQIAASECTSPAEAGVPVLLTACPAGTKEVEVCGEARSTTTTTGTGTGTGTGDSGGGSTAAGCDPEICANGSGCYCTFPVGSPGSHCDCSGALP